MQVKWENLKNFASERGLSIQWVDTGNRYHLVAFDGVFSLECELDKNLDQGSVSDFESNFKPNGNKRLEELKDEDRSVIQKQKITTSGWAYQLHCFEFETSKLNSVNSRKEDGSNYNFATMKFYKTENGSEIEITGEDLNQSFLDLNCTKTVVDWEPTHDYDIIGGALKQKQVPSQDVSLWVTGVPDVPAQYGGSKVFVSGVQLAYTGTDQGLRIDGRVPKYMSYNETYHTNKFRLTLRHTAGFKHSLCMEFEIFRP